MSVAHCKFSWAMSSLQCCFLEIEKEPRLLHGALLFVLHAAARLGCEHQDIRPRDPVDATMGAVTRWQSQVQ